MSKPNVTTFPEEVTPENLEEALQQAINLEIATIPTYLYTYYSIKRAWSQEDSSSDATVTDPINLSSAPGMRAFMKKEAASRGHALSDQQLEELSIDVQVYANEAAGLIMSVVIEEMLHMALTSNVKQARFGPPELYTSMPEFPAFLPGHIPYFPINAAKFSQDQLKTFLKIESPLPFTGSPEEGEGVIEYKTIGEFYEAIIDCVEHKDKDGTYDSDRPQLRPGSNYYSQNTINTVYYDREHNPKFPSNYDSGDLIHVVSRESAKQAMVEVIDQGEGHKGGDHLNPDGEPICPNIDWNDPCQINELDFDDKAHKELSHFAKFLKLYCQGEKLIQKFDALGLDFHAFFVHNVPENPRTMPAAGHPDYSADPDVVAVSNLINGLYSYIFLMVESCYYNDDPAQFEVFMLGIHKNMIWALSSVCNEVTPYQITIGGETCSVGPTFEPFDFSQSNRSPRQQIADLVEKAPSSGPLNCSWVMDYVRNFPDVSLDHKVSKDPLLPALVPPQKIPPLELHACMGLNACKGHDYFGTNECAGMGQCATQHHSCHTLNNCRGQGGCGLFGSTEEQCHPGENDCAFQGSCGTPIPAARFVTQGPNKGRSVWQIARARFEERMKKAKRSVGPSPMPNGPTLEWLGAHVNWTDSCGQSGDKSCSFVNEEQRKKRHAEFVKRSAEKLPDSLHNCDCSSESSDPSEV